MNLIEYNYVFIHFWQVIQKLDEENMRSRKFLHSSSFELVTRECEARYVTDHLDFLHSECRDIVQKEKRAGACCDVTHIASF